MSMTKMHLQMVNGDVRAIRDANHSSVPIGSHATIGTLTKFQA